MTDTRKPSQRAEQVLETVDTARRAAEQVKALASGQGAAAVANTLVALAGQVAGLARPMERVHFTFRSKGAPEARWRVVEMEAHEALSELYTCRVDLAEEDLSADVDALLGQPCEFLIQRGDTSPRRFGGLVRRVEHLGTRGHHLLARVHIAPALWALSQRKDSYIFQEMTVPDILEEVLGEGLRPWSRQARLQLTREYPLREYCVQYQETDLDFALRLMEEEGIGFYFDHSGEEEELVLFDASAQLQPCAAMRRGPLPLHGPEAETAESECVRTLELVHQLQPTAVMVRDFDWTRPGALSHRGQEAQPLGADREQYEYPAPLTLSGYQEEQGRYTEEDSRIQSTLRRQTLEARRRQGQGQGNAPSFSPGTTFAVSGHLRSELDGTWLLTRVEHRGWAPEELPLLPERERAGLPGERYVNRFQCMPHSLPYRPERRTPRPRISGMQTATVVGPQEEEIHTDRHGRIKVQFHWDRAGQGDDRSSCFIRVAQPWAGPGWGFVFLPRVGMEVLVDFLEGNPDRPLVLGCVYNGQAHPPYTLPEHRTRSTLKTSSSPGGEGFNELRFEDARGQEEIYLHAQKDFNEEVLHCHTTTVGADQANTVEGSQTESITGEQAMTVTGNRTKTVRQSEVTLVEVDRTETVRRHERITVEGNRTESVSGEESLRIGAGRTAQVERQDVLRLTGRRQVEISETDTLKVTQDKTDHIQQSYVLTTDKKLEVQQGTTRLKLEGDAALLKAKQPITVQNDETNSIILAEGKVQIKAATEFSVVCGSASLVLKSDGTLTFTGAKELGLGVQQSTVKLEASGVTVSSPKIASTAVGMHEISGALIKIN